MPPVNGHGPQGEPARRVASDDEPFSALAFKVMNDELHGQLTYFRVYSGQVESGATVYNPGKGRRERIGRLVRMHANKREEIRHVTCGNIAAALGLRGTTTGDTLCDPRSPITLELMSFPPPAMSIAIEPKSDSQQDKLRQALERLAIEDPSFAVNTHPETGQTLISGMGELHLEIIVDRLVREFQVEANVGRPQVTYRETILEAGEAEVKHTTPIGGRGQYGHVRLRLEPLPERRGVEFESRAGGGSVPRDFVGAVERGAREALSRGIVAGHPISDVRIILEDGSHHPVDSTEMAFQLAAFQATRQAAAAAHLILLEPLMSLEVVTPDEFLGSVLGNLSARRARVVGMEARGSAQAIAAEVPLSTMFGYATDVRSLTQGRATFTMQFMRYAPVPAHLTEAIALRGRAG
jgi:elongation factor G